MTEKDTTIRFYQNLRIDPGYKNTYWFNNIRDQNDFFAVGAIEPLFDYQFLRKDEGKLRVSIPLEEAETYNYMWFSNISHSVKRYYCFILRAEYLNDATTMIYYQVDVMQTFLFDHTLLPSFVVREHTDDDEYPSVTPEGLEFGRYYARDSFMGGINRDGQLYCIASSVSDTGETATGGLYAGIYSGIEILATESVSNLNDYIESATNANKIDSIINIFMMPKRLYRPKGSTEQATFTIDVPMNRNFGGYVPRNNKLYFYPYNVLAVNNSQGNGAEYIYEDFAKIDIGGKKYCRFVIGAAMGCNPKVLCYPQGYRGRENYYEEGLSIEGFPQCGFVSDTFRAFLAQNANSLPVQKMAIANQDKWGTISAIGQIASGAVGMAAGAGTGNGAAVVGGLSETVGGVLSYMQNQDNTALATAQMMAKIKDVSTLPAQARGTNSTDVLYGYGLLDFSFNPMSISPYYAKILDDYFDKYGYATHQLKIPNREVRENWCFTQTVDCNLYGDIPQQYLNELRRAYDRGVTFWKDGNRIGEYWLPNAAVGRG